MKIFSLKSIEVSKFSNRGKTILVTRPFGHSLCGTFPFVMHRHPVWADKFHANVIMTFATKKPVL